MEIRTAIAFAPASVGNVCVGFDVLGHAFPLLGDRVRASRSGTPGVHITAIDGAATDIPRDSRKNTAGGAVQSLFEQVRPDFGVDLAIEKGIPLGSGLGGSAASAVAAVMAANELLIAPLERAALLPHAMAGEAIASCSLHADNVAPALLGGLVLAVGTVARRIRVPPELRCVVAHPHMQLATREARRILAPQVALADYVRQSANLAGFVAGCQMGDHELIRTCFRDVIIEPQRARLIPGFEGVKAAALTAGALGCSISGAGPSVFAWCVEPESGAVLRGMRDAFARAGLDCEVWASVIDGEGARIEERD